MPCYGEKESQVFCLLPAFSKTELRFPILFELPPELKILMQLPEKSPELVSVFIESSKSFS
jgi:hypothetical protein